MCVADGPPTGSIVKLAVQDSFPLSLLSLSWSGLVNATCGSNNPAGCSLNIGFANVTLTSGQLATSTVLLVQGGTQVTIASSNSILSGTITTLPVTGSNDVLLSLTATVRSGTSLALVGTSTTAIVINGGVLVSAPLSVINVLAAVTVTTATISGSSLVLDQCTITGQATLTGVATINVNQGAAHTTTFALGTVPMSLQSVSWTNGIIAVTGTDLAANLTIATVTMSAPSQLTTTGAAITVRGGTMAGVVSGSGSLQIVIAITATVNTLQISATGPATILVTQSTFVVTTANAFTIGANTVVDRNVVINGAGTATTILSGPTLLSGCVVATPIINGPLAGITTVFETPFALATLTLWSGTIQTIGLASFTLTSAILTPSVTTPVFDSSSGASLYGTISIGSAVLHLIGASVTVGQTLVLSPFSGSVHTGTFSVPFLSAFTVRGGNVASGVISGGGTVTLASGSVMSGVDVTGLTTTIGKSARCGFRVHFVLLCCVLCSRSVIRFIVDMGGAQYHPCYHLVRQSRCEWQWVSLHRHRSHDCECCQPHDHR